MNFRTQQDLGDYVRQLRLEADMTQDELASAIGLAQPDLSKVERGVRGLSSVEAITVAREFGITVEDLLTVNNDDLLIALRQGDGSNEGIATAVSAVKTAADELAHLRALLP